MSHTNCDRILLLNRHYLSYLLLCTRLFRYWDHSEILRVLELIGLLLRCHFTPLILHKVGLFLVTRRKRERRYTLDLLFQHESFLADQVNLIGDRRFYLLLHFLRNFFLWCFFHLSFLDHFRRIFFFFVLVLFSCRSFRQRLRYLLVLNLKCCRSLILTSLLLRVRYRCLCLLLRSCFLDTLRTNERKAVDDR